MKKLIPLTLILLTSCFPSFEGERSLEELYRMRIPNSPNVIYEFWYEGPMAFSSPFFGTCILDSSESFKESKIIEFPGDFIFTIENHDSLNIVQMRYPESIKDSSLTPVKVYSLTQNGIRMNVTQYNRMGGYTVSGCGQREYYFKSFKETSDSLIFYGVQRKFGEIKPDTVGYKKGFIKVVETAEGNVKQIEVNELVIGKKKTYFPENPTTVVDNQPVICSGTNHFYPLDTIPANEFSEFGLFRIIKKVPNKTYTQ